MNGYLFLIFPPKADPQGRAAIGGPALRHDLSSRYASFYFPHFAGWLTGGGGASAG
jgi:hypothetical protein